MDNPVLVRSYPAAESLVDDQYKFVVLTSTGTVRRPDSEAEVAQGILQNAPAAGEAAAVMEIGVSKFHANAALGIGTFIMPEYVGAADAGKGKTAAGSLQYARGIVVEATGAEDDLGAVLLLGPYPAINDSVAHVSAVATISTVGNVTLTAAQMIGGLVLRDPAGGARADLLDTAENIVGAIAGAIIGSSFEFVIRNTADAGETITVTTNTGLTLSGTMTIAQNYSKRFLAVCTNVTAGQEAVTVYSLGTVVH